jgi:hypothetical protein
MEKVSSRVYAAIYTHFAAGNDIQICIFEVNEIFLWAGTPIGDQG